MSKITVTIHCPDCDGTGTVRNEMFEHYCTLPLDDPDHWARGGPCKGCPGWKTCAEGECMECQTCDGKGFWKFNSDEYNIQIDFTNYYGPVDQ